MNRNKLLLAVVLSLATVGRAVSFGAALSVSQARGGRVNKPATAAGLRISGSTPDGTYVEMVELPDHPHFIGCQFHPEFKSKPLEPHPLFRTFIGAAYEHARQRESKKNAAELEMFHRPVKVASR